MLTETLNVSIIVLQFPKFRLVKYFTLSKQICVQGAK